MRFRPAISIKARLLAGSLVWMAITLAVTGIVLTGMFRDHVSQRFDAELTAQLDQLLANLQVTSDGQFRLIHPIADPRFERPYSSLYWQVDGPNGAMLRSRSLWDQSLPLAHDAPSSGELHRHLIDGPAGQHLVAVERRVILPETTEVVRAAVAGSADVVNAATREFALTAATTLGVLAIGLLVVILVQAVTTLRPLARLQASLAAVRQGQANQLSGQFPSEVQPLVNDLNGLLKHNADVLERARTEAGNLAHQLKTPLAIIANTASLLPDADPARTLLEQTRLVSRRIDYALKRARAAASGKVLSARAIIEPQIERMVEAMRTLHADRGLQIVWEARTRTTARIEVQDFDEVIGNLLDNACKWARTRVEARVECVASRVRVIIEEDGPGLPEAERRSVFERGRKLDESAEGSGIGLAIVHDIVAAYDGTVSLEAADGGGVRAMVTLPGVAGKVRLRSDNVQVRGVIHGMAKS